MTTPISATRIEVDAFRTILLWPLVLRLSDGDIESKKTPGKILHEAVDSVKAAQATGYESNGDKSPVWHHVPDLLDHASPLRKAVAQSTSGTDAAQEGKQEEVDPRDKLEDRAQNYQEFVYFHDYIQSVLFARSAPDQHTKPLINLFRRDDIESCRLVLDRNDSGESTLEVEALVNRCNLYLVEGGIALLAVELDFMPGKMPMKGETPRQCNRASGKPLTLADVQKITNRLRRVYAPYFETWKPTPDPGQSPLEFNWLSRDGSKILGLDGVWHDEKCRKGANTPHLLEDVFPDNLQGTEVDQPPPSRKPGNIRLEDRSGRRTPPVFDWWRALVHPLELAGYESDPQSGPPTWRHVLDERMPMMSFVALPQGMTEAVSRGDWMRLCFADDPGKNPYPYNERFLENFESNHCYDRYFSSSYHSSSTRFMFCGYHFCVVGGPKSAGFNYFRETIIHHFRRHYFQMMLISQIEFANLLAISGRLSEIVQRYRNARLSSPEQAHDCFAGELTGLQRDFLEFVHLFRFTGVSNQLQAKEMFAMLRNSLELDALYKDVKDELESAFDYLQSTRQTELGEAANKLSGIALVGVVLGFAAAILGMNIVFNDAALREILSWFIAAESGTAPAAQGGDQGALLRHLYLAGLIFTGAALFGLLAAEGSSGSRSAMAQPRAILRGVAVCGFLATALAAALLATGGSASGLIWLPVAVMFSVLMAASIAARTR